MGLWDGSSISRTTCKQSARRSRQITTTTPHHSISTGRMLFLTPHQQCQSTEGIINSWRKLAYFLSFFVHQNVAVKMDREEDQCFLCGSAALSVVLTWCIVCCWQAEWRCCVRQPRTTAELLSSVIQPTTTGLLSYWLQWTGLDTAADFVGHTCSLQGLNCWLNYTVTRWCRQGKKSLKSWQKILFCSYN